MHALCFGLKLNIQKMKIMASGPITSWKIDGERVETVSDFIFGGSKIPAYVDCSHEIKRRLLLGRKVMTNLDSILKSRDITLPTEVHLAKAMVFPVVMYGCKSWTVKKAERRRIDAFELWCWRRLLRVPFLEEISSLSHSVVFLCFFALIAEEGFLISSCYSLVLCIQSLISFLFSFAFHFSSFLSY